MSSVGGGSGSGGGGAGPTPFTELSATDYAAGLWYSSNQGGFTIATNGTSANGIMSLIPFVPRFTHVFTGIGWFHSSAAENAHNIRLGIYGSVGGAPSGAAIVDSGSIATTAAAALMTATISQQLSAGQMYWLAALSDSSLTGASWLAAAPNYAWAANGLISPAAALVASTTGGVLGYTQVASFGALPTIGTLTDNAHASSYPLAVMLKG